MRILKDMEVQGKKVLLRVDFNVPIEENGDMKDDSRIKAAVPTIQYLLEHDCKQLIIMSHFGDPDGKVVDKYKMDKICERLIQIIERSVYKTNDCLLKRVPSDHIILLENLRFHKEEKENDEAFAMKLASYADLYVNDAFGECHRSYASVHSITKFLPGCIGFLIEKELEMLNIDKMEHPIITIIGGAKLKTKIPLIQRMLIKSDKVIVGGGMIFTFYAAKGLNIGESLFDADYEKNAEIMQHNERLYLPTDVVVANASKTDIKTVVIEEIPKNFIGLDVGEKSVEKIKELLKDAKTILWNGPLGYYERAPFNKATNDIATFISELSCNKIAGGGDTSDVINSLELGPKFTFISSGGGAALEVLSGNKLAALQALEDNQ